MARVVCPDVPDQIKAQATQLVDVHGFSLALLAISVLMAERCPQSTDWRMSEGWLDNAIIDASVAEKRPDIDTFGLFDVVEREVKPCSAQS